MLRLCATPWQYSCHHRHSVSPCIHPVWMKPFKTCSSVQESKPGLCYYRCLSCRKTFGQPESMTGHLRISLCLQVTCETMCPEGRCLPAACQRVLFMQQLLFLCHKCGREFVGKKTLHEHVRSHAPTYKIYTCDVCGFTTKRLDSYKMHLERHKDVRVRACVCDICGKAYFDKSALRDHRKRTHLRDTEFKCSVCSRVFYLKQELLRHMRNHQGIRPYRCDECGQCFATGYNLRVHQRIHTGEKPYKCSECAACFAQKNSLNVHMKKHLKPEVDDSAESHCLQNSLQPNIKMFTIQISPR